MNENDELVKLSPVGEVPKSLESGTPQKRVVWYFEMTYGRMKYKKSVARQYFMTKEEAETHAPKLKSKEVYFCETCAYDFDDIGSYNDHMAYHKENVCQYCFEIYETKEEAAKCCPLVKDKLKAKTTIIPPGGIDKS